MNTDKKFNITDILSRNSNEEPIYFYYVKIIKILKIAQNNIFKISMKMLSEIMLYSKHFYVISRHWYHYIIKLRMLKK